MSMPPSISKAATFLLVAAIGVAIGNLWPFRQNECTVGAIGDLDLGGEIIFLEPILPKRELSHETEKAGLRFDVNQAKDDEHRRQIQETRDKIIAILREQFDKLTEAEQQSGGQSYVYRIRDETGKREEGYVVVGKDGLIAEQIFEIRY